MAAPQRKLVTVVADSGLTSERPVDHAHVGVARDERSDARDGGEDQGACEGTAGKLLVAQHFGDSMAGGSLLPAVGDDDPHG